MAKLKSAWTMHLASVRNRFFDHLDATAITQVADALSAVAGAPAAKRGRTTWRRGEATATLGREEGPTGSRTRLRSHDCKENPGNRLTPTAKRTRYVRQPDLGAAASTASRMGSFARAGGPDCSPVRVSDRGVGRWRLLGALTASSQHPGMGCTAWPGVVAVRRPTIVPATARSFRRAAGGVRQGNRRGAGAVGLRPCRGQTNH